MKHPITILVRHVTITLARQEPRTTTYDVEMPHLPRVGDHITLMGEVLLPVVQVIHNLNGTPETVVVVEKVERTEPTRSTLGR